MEFSSYHKVIQELKKVEESAYKRGWNDAYKAFHTALKNNSSSMAGIVSDSAVKNTDRSSHKATSTVSLVRKFIKENPGLTGIQIIRLIQTEEDPSVHERTVRTALHRLKNRGFIRVEDGKWY